MVLNIKDKIIMKLQKSKAFTALQSPVLFSLWSPDILRLTQRKRLRHREVRRVTMSHTDCSRKKDPWNFSSPNAPANPSFLLGSNKPVIRC